MSDETKSDFLIAFIATAIVVILVIVFGNTGSGFFRNLMVFVVGSLIGTPLAMFGKWIISLFSDNELYKYGSFILGAIVGAGIASTMFSNKLETSFISQCTRGYGISKSICECTYHKFENKYDNSLESILTSQFDENTTNFMLKSIQECE